MSEKPWQPDPEHDVVLDAQLLRALAHPMRVKIVGLLRVHGPATATTLAHRLAVNTGATSYHLRELAKVGLVVEDESRGNARDRWWKSAHRSSHLNETELLRTDPDLALGYLYSVAQTNAEATLRYIDELPALPKAWQEAGTISDYGFRLTPAQLTEMLEEIQVVLERYRSDPDEHPLPGSRSVAVQIQAFPREVR